MGTAMHYPCNYGYVPNTIADDGDPVDVLVITPFPLTAGVVVRCRPLGVLKMEDEAGGETLNRFERLFCFAHLHTSLLSLQQTPI